MPGPKRRPLRELFDERFSPGAPGECWPWRGAMRPDGYGCLGSGRKIHLSHRLAYTFLVGPIADGLTIDHLCRNRACVNPAHLEPVTRGENTRRGLALRQWNPSSAKTHCPEGHPYDETNTYIHPTRGSRICLTCKRKREREAVKKKRDANPGVYAGYFRDYRKKNGVRITEQERERRVRRKAEPSA